MSRPLVDGPKYINFQFESRRSCMEYMETITFHDVDRDSRLESLVVVVCGGNSNSSNLKIARRGVLWRETTSTASTRYTVFQFAQNLS